MSVGLGTVGVACYQHGDISCNSCSGMDGLELVTYRKRNEVGEEWRFKFGAGKRLD